ncbi:MAG TPA: hypothetical protein VIX86_20045 [Streptosporangiaceae bacterium]
MLRSQAALWESTGSLEMSVFHTLLAGNIGQFGAPGTVVPVTAAVPAEAVPVGLAPDVAGLAGPAGVALVAAGG